MSLEENKAIARRYIEELWSNPDVIDELVAEEIAWPNTTQRRDDFKADWLQTVAAFPDAQLTVLWVMSEGDHVAVAAKGKGTHTAEGWMGVPPTNKEVEWFVWRRVQIADGKIVAMDQIWTVLYVLNQMGLSPSFNELVEQAGGKVE